MVIGSNINNYLECKWIKFSNQKTHLLSGYQKKKKERTCIYTVYKRHTSVRPSNIYKLKVRGCKKILHANGNFKKNGVALLVLDNIDFKIKTATRDKEGHYTMIKGLIQEAITIISIYAPT